MKTYKIYYGYMGLEFNIILTGSNNKSELIDRMLRQGIIQHRGHINRIELIK